MQVPLQGASPSTAWIRSIDATYSIFESEQYRQEYAPLSEQVREAVLLCEQVVAELGIGQCALSFNGGKDCTVLIHILSAVLRRLSKSPQSSSSSQRLEDNLPSIPSLYISCKSPFKEVEDFISDSIRRYNLNIVRLEGDMKEGLERYLDGEGAEMVARRDNGHVLQDQNTATQNRSIKAIFVGTRRTDPHCGELKARQHTDPGWPDVERIQPILDWSYQDVWTFLRCPLFAVSEDDVVTSASSSSVRWGEPYGIPYCILYDEGYTSLGSTFNTFPNPILDTRQRQREVQDDKTKRRWKPAYMLEDESLERAGRMTKKQ